MAKKIVSKTTKNINKKLSKDEANKIIEDRTNFSKTYFIKDGTEAPVDFAEKDGEKTVVTIQFNETVRKRINKYISTLLGMRGIKDTDNLNESDPDVKKLLKAWTKRQKRRFIPTEEKNRQQNVYIETVKRANRPYFMATMLQVIAWSLMYDDVFRVKRGNIELDLEIEIKEDYWESKESDNDDSELDDLLSEYKVDQVVFDKTNPLEIMVAMSTQLMESNKDFSESISKHFQIVIVNMSMYDTEKEFDDAGFLNRTLDDALSNDVDAASDAIDG